MRPSLFLIALSSTLATAALPPYNISDYISDCIESFCYYTFTITYTPPSPHSYKIPLTEPAFSASCEYSTDDGANYILCDDKSVKTIGDFSSEQDLKLTAVHSWDVPATAARVAGTVSRTVKKTVELYLGSAGTSATFKMSGGSETFTAANQTVASNKRTEGKERRDTSVFEQRIKAPVV